MANLIFTIFLLFVFNLFSQCTVKSEKIEKAFEYHKDREGECMIIMYDGNIIFEKYTGKGSPDRLQWLASGSKSFVGIVAAAGVEDGIINLDDKVSEVIEEWKNDPLKSRITYKHLLNLTSGLSPDLKNILNLTWKDLVNVPSVETPGKKFRYGGVSHNIFAYAFQLKLKNETFESYLKRRILDPLSVKIEYKMKFKDGNPQVAGGAYMTGRDWAKFGEFIRLDGTINGKKIIDSKVLSECFKGSEVYPIYGLTWWLIGKIDHKNANLITNLIIDSVGWRKLSRLKSIPQDLVAACGAGGQRLYIIPSLKIVIVRLGDLTTKDKKFKDSEFLSLIFDN
ncbi:MAG: beta-lactamase family protein [Candidatus Omnitrophica bacterium]|nr:beta-lactamase family protein [Candidatus Omnitrophota bacterium]MCM8802521.1 beta-lactamase family protein [Candidatus Omnitrophota bacterium]